MKVYYIWRDKKEIKMKRSRKRKKNKTLSRSKKGLIILIIITVLLCVVTTLKKQEQSKEYTENKSDYIDSVKPDIDIPPSLVNIYQELHDDLGCYIPNNGYLKKWADQGVMLLNTVLTVRAHQANSHHDIGWEQFTDAAIRVLNEQDRPMVFILWGRPAQAKKAMLNNPKHMILEAPHPSPLSAYRGFFGSRPFSKTNDFLRKHGLEPVDWQIENIEKQAK